MELNAKAFFFCLLTFLICFLCGCFAKESKTNKNSTIYDCNGNQLVKNDHGQRTYNYHGAALQTIGLPGTSGVEKSYESYMQNGNELFLSIDIHKQKTVEDSLNNTLQEIFKTHVKDFSVGYDVKGGSVVVLDVNSGAVLAMANCSFSANDSKSEQNTSINKTVNGLYPPGSTFKPIVAAAALEEQVITPDWTYTCNGYYNYFKNYKPTCFKKTVHQTQTVSEALHNSCNCFFFEAGRMTGIDTIERYAGLFGFGQKTGVDLPDETGGVIAGKTNSQKSGKPFKEEDTIQAAIGQSDTLVTPLQLASYAQTIASDGLCNRPYVVSRITNGEQMLYKRQPTISRKISLKDSTLQSIKEGMKRQKTDGSFSGIKTDFAMKTGTAELKSGSPHALVIGFAPFNHPQIAFAIVAENGGYSGYLYGLVRDLIELYC